MVAAAAASQAFGRTASAETATRGVQLSVMLWTLEKLAPFDRCLEMVAAAGYQGVELVGEFQRWSAEETQLKLARMKALGLRVDSMSGVKAGFAVLEERESFFIQFAAHLEAAKRLGCPQVILLSGKRVPGTGHGGPGVSFPDGAGPCACRGARALCGVSVREHLGLRECFVHPRTPNPPASQNAPGKSGHLKHVS